MERIEDVVLTLSHLFSISGQIGGLIDMNGINDWSTVQVCCSENYVQAFTSQFTLLVDPILVENEIGGVIMGSLKSDLNQCPLSCVKELDDIWSNVASTIQHGKKSHGIIYNKF